MLGETWGGVSVSDQLVCVVLGTMFAGRDLEDEGETEQRLLRFSITHHLQKTTKQQHYLTSQNMKISISLVSS